MKKRIIFENEEIELEGEAVDMLNKLAKMLAGRRSERKKLSEIPVGELIQIGKHEMIVLGHSGDTTAVICKDPILENEMFGTTNNYDGSNVDKRCNEFAEGIASIVGDENMVMHTVDLTSDDGLKCYGKIQRRASLLTTELYRRYVDVLDEFPQKTWWWLATAFSTKKHDDESWVKCVSPSGCVSFGHYYRDNGVRPFCILKSNIFVSN